MKDYYRILEVHSKASPEVIEKAYKALTFKYHPDRNPHIESEATAKMSEINEAYAALSDPSRRARYDLTRAPDLSDAMREAARLAQEKNLGQVLWSRGLIGVAQVLREESKHKTL